MSLGTILVILLIIFLLGGFGSHLGAPWQYGYGYGNGGIGGIGLILLIVVVLLVLGVLR